MPKTLTLRHVPDDVVEALRARAERNQRSMQRELLSIVQAVVVDRGQALTALDALRQSVKEPMTLDEIDAAVGDGRP